MSKLALPLAFLLLLASTALAAVLPSSSFILHPSSFPIVSLSVHHDRLPSLAQVTPRRAETDAVDPPIVGLLPRKTTLLQFEAAPGAPVFPDLGAMPSPQFNFPGLSNEDNFAVLATRFIPPDPNGEVGAQHYIQWVNKTFAVWALDRPSHTAALAYGPAAGNTLWAGFGGPCETYNSGDPIVNYDSLASRWVMTQPAWAGEIPEYHQCFAVSESADPLGAWYRYDFFISAEKFNDYPKLAVWGDAYYLTFNQFGGGWAGQGVAALERAAMLAGLPAQMVYFDLFDTDPNLGGMLPADTDGPTPPPAGTPGYFVEMDDNAYGYSPDQLQIWRFNIDWVDAAAAVFTRTQVIELGSLGLGFDTHFCDASRGQCLPQPEVDAQLEIISDRLMPRVVYRNFGSYQALALNHTIDADGTAHAGVRWYELRLAAGVFSLNQAGTYAPDGDHRWMGSLAFDRAGNLALGYTVTGSAVYPSIRYTGRLAGDPPGSLAQGEAVLIAGGGAQTSFSARWGDYSNMSVDPLDDCTFWYTHEYYPATSSVGWHTRIGSFRFPSCTVLPAGNLQGIIHSATSGELIANARIQASDEIVTFSDENGRYRLIHLPEGDYTLRVAAYGYEQTFAGGVSVSAGLTETRDVALVPLPPAVANGVVTDSGLPGASPGAQPGAHGWPLYARLDLAAAGFAATAYTDPLNGTYSLTLYADTAYSLTVSAPGYHSLTRVITPPAISENFTLAVAPLSCAALGYKPESVYFESFEASTGGYTTTVDSPIPSSWAWGAPVNGPGFAHSGQNVWATNLSGAYNNSENSSLLSPVIDLSAHAGNLIALSWFQWAATERYYDFISIEVSRNAGLDWRRVYGEISGDIAGAWMRRTLLLDESYASAGFRLRFRIVTNNSTAEDGFYVDDVSVGVIPLPTATAYSEDFEASAGGYTVTGVTSWEWGAPVSGPGAAHSGQNAWGANLSANYGDNETGYLLSPPIDLSAHAGQTLLVNWVQWLETESGFDFASLEASRDGGKTWLRLYDSVSGNVDSDWAPHYAALDSSYAVADFRLRYRLQSDPAVTAPGYFVDDVRVLTLPALPAALCAAQDGGLVYGLVTAPDSAGVPGALVGVQASVPPTFTADTTLTVVTPDDAALGDGFFALFAPAGEQVIAAAFGVLRASAPVTVTPGSIHWLEFELPVKRLWLPMVGK